MEPIVRLSDYRRRKSRVYFSRSELSQLLSLYSIRVACGEWRDYAIDHAVGAAVFSVFRHTHDRPAYAVAKSVGPRGTDYAVFETGRRLKRGACLADVLSVFDRPVRLITD